MKILIVEDDERVSSFIAKVLVRQGHDFELTDTGPSALAAAAAGDFDVIVLDVNLPGMTGFEVAHRIREKGHKTPILMLTGRTAEGDVIRGLNVGADDYMTKPFRPGELLARLRALVRRRASARTATLRYKGLAVDRIEDVVSAGGHAIPLTPTEFKLLVALLLQEGRVASKDFLLERLWGGRLSTSTSLLTVHIKHLRSKLTDHGVEDLIETVRGVGYRMRASS